ncbi:putative ribonuclease H-like domain-containing protein [Tanacetum coccineum]
MAALKYRDEHNKIGFLEKPKGSTDYHQVIDFLLDSHIRYAIVTDPLIYDSLITQFWSTASLRSSELGPPAIVATIDGTPYTITESLVRSQLQLHDEGGIVDMPIPDIFLGMDNLGYPTEGKLTFHKNKFSPQWSIHVEGGIDGYAGDGAWGSLILYSLHCLSTKSGVGIQFGDTSFGYSFNLFLQMILDIETRITKPYHAVRLTSKMFANMRLNFHGDHMSLVAVMLPPPQAAIAAGISEEAAPPNSKTDHETVTDPSPTVSSHDHGSTSPRPTPTTPAAQLNKPVSKPSSFTWSINLDAAAVLVVDAAAVSILKALKTEDLSRNLEVNYVKFQFRGGLLDSNVQFYLFCSVGKIFTNADDLLTDPLMPDLEDTADLLNTGIFSGAYDDEDVGAEADLNNLENTMNVSPIPTTRNHKIEAIRLFFAYASFMGFIVYQMDVKSAFLYGTNEEEVYVYQPPSFEDLQFLDKVYKVEKALYSLHQAPRAWYETLSTYLLENGFRRWIIDKTLFIKKNQGDILLVQVYVDDIIFGSTKKLCREIMESSSAKITSRPDIMFAFCACARFQVTPKVSHLHAVKRIFRYLKDSDYAGASLDRKSIIGGCQFLGKRLISWQCKKQTVVANSTTEAEYVDAANCCGQTQKPKKAKRTTEISQSSGPIPLVIDETIIKEWEDRMERATTTVSSLDAEQDNGNINRTQSMATLNESFPQGTDSSSGPSYLAGLIGRTSMKLKELMEFCTKLSERDLDL